MSSTPDVIPRVSLAGLAEHVGRRVLLVAKVESVDPSGTTVTLSSPPPAAAGAGAPETGPRVLVQRPPGGGGGAYDTAFAEVDGVVVDPTTLREESHTNFSDGFGTQRVFLLKGGSAEAPSLALPLSRSVSRVSSSLVARAVAEQTNKQTNQKTRLQCVHGGAQDDRKAAVRGRLCLRRCCVAPLERPGRRGSESERKTRAARHTHPPDREKNRRPKHFLQNHTKHIYKM
jgi:hypothetical protein